MTASRKKDEPLSETTKSYLRDLYLREVWGREKSDMLGNKFTQKGIMCETDSIQLVENVTGNKYFKNLKTFKNNYLVGTPDIISPVLIDIKTSWDLFTFSAVNEEKAKKDYYYQLLGYMFLTGQHASRLVYSLVNTPDDITNQELYKLSFNMPNGEHMKYKNNYIFDDIPESLKIKYYDFVYSQEEIEKLKLKIIDAREYLSHLTI